MREKEKQCEKRKQTYFQIFKSLHFQIKQALLKTVADPIQQGLRHLPIFLQSTRLLRFQFH